MNINSLLPHNANANQNAVSIQLEKKWERTGLLEGLNNEVERKSMAVLTKANGLKKCLKFLNLKLHLLKFKKCLIISMRLVKTRLCLSWQTEVLVKRWALLQSQRLLPLLKASRSSSSMASSVNASKKLLLRLQSKPLSEPNLERDSVKTERPSLGSLRCIDN